MQLGLRVTMFGLGIKQRVADIDILSQIEKTYVFDFVENTAIIIVIFIKDKTHLSDGTHIIDFLNKEGIRYYSFL